jgi:hypothetical protein
MKVSFLFIFVLVIIQAIPGAAQKIVYSEPDKDDSRRMDFEIAGKIGGNILIYKNTRGKNWITVLDNDMLEVDKVEQAYVPDNDRMINVEFFPYTDFCYMVYQYQKKNVVYCMASKIGPDGRKIGNVVQIDTTHIGFAANNKIYTVLSSEDKSRMIIFKINSRNRRHYLMTTLLVNQKLDLLKKSKLHIPMEDRNEYLHDFYLDNEGDMVFSKFFRASNDNISRAAFVVKYAMADSLSSNDLMIDKTWLDEIHIKVDNYNKRYILTSFYFNERRGNIDGLYFYTWDKGTRQPHFEKTYEFSEEFRKEARGDASIRMAFNDYFVKDIITRKDGGYIIATEAYYTSSRFNNWNRWDYLYGSPYMSSFNNSYYYSPYYSNYYWRTRSGSNQAMRYHADNIAVLSFDGLGNAEWNNVVGKTQYDDETDDLLSYQMMNTGGEVHFLFNQQERRTNLLSDYSITPTGVMTRNPTLKNLDKGYEFMPKYAKQISAKQMIVPCLYRNYICFAKIDYSQH